MNIAELTLESASEIYRQDYWDKLNANSLPPALALASFDFAVNSGVFRSSSYLQEEVGTKVDGEVGPLTLAAVGIAAAQRGRRFLGGGGLCAG